jgi:hypothetical protein
MIIISLPLEHTGGAGPRKSSPPRQRQLALPALQATGTNATTSTTSSAQ